jgi:hypothetical protein
MVFLKFFLTCVKLKLGSGSASKPLQRFLTQYSPTVKTGQLRLSCQEKQENILLYYTAKKADEK